MERGSCRAAFWTFYFAQVVILVYHCPENIVVRHKHVVLALQVVTISPVFSQVCKNEISDKVLFEPGASALVAMHNQETTYAHVCDLLRKCSL
jgi:hypothetical protein